jgi:hypothetical protein
VPADFEMHNHGHGNLSARKHSHIKVR